MAPTPSSFRRRPESSGLDKPFPQRGNDNHRHNNRTRHPLKTSSHPTPRPLLDSSLCRNDNEQGKSGLPSRQPLSIPDRCLTAAHPSFMDRKSCMRREGREARSRPAKAGIQKTWPKRQMEPGLCLSATGLKVIPRVVIPAAGGNVLHKPLDSGLRRNDDGGIDTHRSCPFCHLWTRLHPCRRACAGMTQ